MLIGIDASRANRDKKTGTEYYSYYLIRNLAKIDSENQYILYTDKPLTNGLINLTSTDDALRASDGQPIFDEQGYQILKSPFNNFKAKVLTWPFRFFWTLGRLSLEMIWHRPDVLFIPAHGLPLISPKKTLTTVHDIAFVRERGSYSTNQIISNVGFSRKLVDFLVRTLTGGKYGANTRDHLYWSTAHAVRSAKKIIAISEFSKQEIIDFYKTDPRRIIVVHNGFNNALCAKSCCRGENCDTLKRFGISGPYFLYVGRLEKKKNTLGLVEAFALALAKNPSLPHKLVLAGKASFGYDDINYAINEFRLGGRVIVTGWIEEKDLACFYSNTVSFIFPSKYEGFGIPLLEAMACGAPVIASELPVIKEIAGEAAYYFDPNDSNAIAKAMLKIAGEAELRKKLISAGTEQVKKFSWKKCAEETLAVIKNM